MRDQTDIGLPFSKMHGLGNDFVVIDGRSWAVDVTPVLARALGDRHRGVGFDQLALIQDVPGADMGLRFWNADGSESSTCGNATRCIARAELDLTGRREITIRTERGLLIARDAGNGLTSVNMGTPQLQWHEIPLSREMDTLELPLEGTPTATSFGNPHCTFFVPDAEAIDLATFGPAHEHHPFFPQRTNVQVVQVIGRDRLRVRVWERGTGVTQASGSSSCAVAVAAARRGLAEREVMVVLDGGELRVQWTDEGVWMTGPTAHVFSGTLTSAFLEALA